MSKLEKLQMGKWSFFNAGVCMTTGVMILIQDILGQAGYMDMISDHWVPSYIGIPIAIVAISVSLLIMLAGEKKA